MEEPQISYRDFVEQLKIEFGDFLRLAETGRVTRHAALKARKQSIKIREMMKKFRELSIDNDKRITIIMAEAKTKISEQGE